MDPKAKNTEIVVRAGDPQSRHLQDVLFSRDGDGDRVRQSVIALPMLVNDAMFGMINVKFHGARQALSDSELHFLKIMAGTAANAIRNAQLFEDTEHRARTDFLTGLPNHRFFQTQLSKELGRAQRHNHSLSLLIIDLDFLKSINDQFGHPTGDAVIRAVAESIRTTCRDFDLPARYGGEEFMVILPETPLAGAIQAAERLRKRIAALDFPAIGGVTASIGIANYPSNALNKDDLIRVADQALYQAKSEGRNRVAYFSQQLTTKPV
jgi:diguanylate cyclase (GGDEF)-like protein